MKQPGAGLRASTAKALFDILELGQSARHVLPKYQERLSTKDKAWLQLVVYGILRDLPQYQFWVRHALDKPLKGNKKVLEHLLMVGFYQLYAMRVADHAAVSATVDAAEKLGGKALKGLINAVLRGFTRDELHTQKVTGEAALVGLPNWLYKAITTQYSEHATQIIEAMQTNAPLWLRINPKYVSRDKYQSMLTAREIDTHTEEALPNAICVNSPVVITELPGYQAGWFAVQDGAAQLAAQILTPLAGEIGLDACAAPGGKTAHLLASQPELKELFALDSDAKRLERVQENLHRLAHSATLICGDATDPATWGEAQSQRFDFILCDAPCSATGVIRRHPDIRWLRKASDIDALVALQATILTTLWERLAPGGRMLYATCSILPQENEAQITAFLAAHDDAEIVTLPDEITDTFTNNAKVGLQILPNTAQCDGFYYALLHKCETA